MMPNVADELVEQAAAAKAASVELAKTSAAERNRALDAIARAIRARARAILDANARDCSHASPRIELDRLRLTEARVEAMARDVEAVSHLEDPLGERFDRTVRPNGLVISKRRVPLGVVGVVYESRPNVTSDVAAICLKTGNAVVLRGGSEALASNTAISEAIHAGLRDAGLPEASVQFIASSDRALVQRMLKLREFIDVIVPRGGQGLIKATIEGSTIPVIETGAGVCHTYVDRAADQEMALRIVYNAKVRRPTICNALDTLLVHREIAETWLPKMAAEWGKAGVEIHADPEAARAIAQARLKSSPTNERSSPTNERSSPTKERSSRTKERSNPANERSSRAKERSGQVVPAVADDWGREFLSLAAAVKVVGSLDEALEHIRAHGSGHSDAIVTGDAAAAERFLNEVDSAAVFVNASTQFTDGGEFGLGTEVGISTQKLHARGPMGLRELTTYKWVVEGTGQVRG